MLGWGWQLGCCGFWNWGGCAALWDLGCLLPGLCPRSSAKLWWGVIRDRMLLLDNPPLYGGADSGHCDLTGPTPQTLQGCPHIARWVLSQGAHNLVLGHCMFLRHCPTHWRWTPCLHPDHDPGTLACLCIARPSFYHNLPPGVVWSRPDLVGKHSREAAPGMALAALAVGTPHCTLLESAVEVSPALHVPQWVFQ